MVHIEALLQRTLLRVFIQSWNIKQQSQNLVVLELYLLACDRSSNIYKYAHPATHTHVHILILFVCNISFDPSCTPPFWFIYFGLLKDVFTVVHHRQAQRKDRVLPVIKITHESTTSRKSVERKVRLKIQPCENVDVIDV